MIIRLTVFGIEVFCLTLGNLVIQTEDDEDEEEEPTGKIGGGSGHNFERDTTPLDPTDHFGEWEFGFGNPKRERKGGRGASD